MEELNKMRWREIGKSKVERDTMNAAATIEEVFVTFEGLEEDTIVYLSFHLSRF